MQIHELTEFQGMPSSGDFLAIDDGERTQKIEAENLGVTTAMTTAEAEAGTSTAKRVMTPKMFHDYVEDNTAKGFVELTQAEYDALTQEEKNDGRVFFITDGMPTPSPYILACYPVGSYYETSDADFDPSTDWGGTWTLVSSKDAYIVDEGTSGDWTYRKWSDGTSECWATYVESTAQEFAQSGNFYYRNITGISFPAGMFTSTPILEASINMGNVGAVQVASLGSTTCGVTVMSAVSTARAVRVYLYAKGKWTNTPETYYRWHRTA